MVISATSGLLAQSASIKGQVSDVANNSPVFAANVVLMKPDTTVITGTASDMNGVFELKRCACSNVIM